MSTPAYILQNFPIDFLYLSIYCLLFDKSRAEESESGFQIFTFLTFFPQLLAGPIVDISTFRNGIKTKVVSLKSMQQGLYRVSLGLIKKFLVADTLSQITSIYINSNYDFIFSYASSIILILSYTFQIYFDFSAYCDIAIGIGLFFGLTYQKIYRTSQNHLKSFGKDGTLHFPIFLRYMFTYHWVEIVYQNIKILEIYGLHFFLQPFGMEQL